MITSLAIVLLLGIALSTLCRTLKIPHIMGLLLTGVLLGPFVWNLISGELLQLSPELREIALVIILLQAGLSLDLKDLKKVGTSSILLAFVPATFEILAFIFFAPLLLNVTVLEGAIMGSVMAAVSPAIVVPKMVKLIEETYGVKRSVPQLIIAGSSLDDIFAIVLFTCFAGMEKSGQVNYLQLFDIPISIATGLVAGVLFAFVLNYVFNKARDLGHEFRSSQKMLLVLGASFLLMAIESTLEGKIAFSGLLAIISMAVGLRTIAKRSTVDHLISKFGKTWVGAEIILFVLVGAAVDINYIAEAGFAAVLLILIALVIRCVGVFVSLVTTNLNMKEKLFCALAYLPKATVQAAIGSVPLSMGLSCGNLVLSVAVLGILITAPLGALAIDLSYKKLLEKSNVNEIEAEEKDRVNILKAVDKAKN